MTGQDSGLCLNIQDMPCDRNLPLLSREALIRHIRMLMANHISTWQHWHQNS